MCVLFQLKLRKVLAVIIFSLREMMMYFLKNFLYKIIFKIIKSTGSSWKMIFILDLYYLHEKDHAVTEKKIRTLDKKLKEVSSV